MILKDLHNKRKWVGDKLKKILITVLILIVNISLLPSQIAYASNASLYLTPGSSSQTIGNNFTVYVGVNSGGNEINAIEATVNLPTNIVSITGAGSGGSLCSIWVQQPTINGSSVSFKCGIPGGTTSNGNLISISLKASVIGSGSASISGVRVLAGPGQDVTGGASGGTFSVVTSAGNAQNESTPSPTVTSSSHSDQNAWYKDTNVSLVWTRPAGVTGFSYVFDQSAGTIPKTSSNTNNLSIENPGTADGIWYFHIRAYGPKGWSATANYKVGIDTTIPSSLAIVTDPSGEADKRPAVSFNAEDATSGIDYYEIKMDEQEFQKATSPYTPSSIKSGDHIFTVRAYDKAGNMIENKATIRIKDVPVPKITTPKPNAIFKLIQSLDISGTADSTTVIDLYIDDVNIAKSIPVNDDGTWSTTYKNLIMPGKHKITAVAVRDGIESNSSDVVNVKIDPSAVSIFGILIPSFVIFIVLLTIIGLLIGLVVRLFIIVKRIKDSLHGKPKEDNMATDQESSEEISGMGRRLQEDIQDIYKDKKLLTSKEKHNLEDKIKNDLKTVEKDIIDTIEKGSKNQPDD
jgi:uncharacterized protein YneF (UPF0154 family)